MYKTFAGILVVLVCLVMMLMDLHWAAFGGMAGWIIGDAIN